jgi:hypothetical protein
MQRKGNGVNDEQKAQIQELADRELELAEEVEASGEAAVGGAALERLRASLHEWVDSVQGVVVNAAFGRVTLIHEGGRRSTVASPDLPYALSTPVGAGREG